MRRGQRSSGCCHFYCTVTAGPLVPEALGAGHEFWWARFRRGAEQTVQLRGADFEVAVDAADVRLHGLEAEVEGLGARGP